MLFEGVGVNKYYFLFSGLMQVLVFYNTPPRRFYNTSETVYMLYLLSALAWKIMRAIGNITFGISYDIIITKNDITEIQILTIIFE